MSKKRKRVEAWAAVFGDGTHLVYGRLDQASGLGGAKVVHLVERSNAEAAVVRAAVRWADSHWYGPNSVPTHTDLLRAVERLKKERNK